MRGLDYLVPEESPIPHPFGPGKDLAEVVAETGPGVSRLGVGDCADIQVEYGAYREHREQVAVVPGFVSGDMAHVKAGRVLVKHVSIIGFQLSDYREREIQTFMGMLDELYR